MITVCETDTLTARSLTTREAVVPVVVVVGGTVVGVGGVEGSAGMVTVPVRGSVVQLKQ